MSRSEFYLLSEKIKDVTNNDENALKWSISHLFHFKTDTPLNKYDAFIHTLLHCNYMTVSLHDSGGPEGFSLYANSPSLT